MLWTETDWIIMKYSVSFDRDYFWKTYSLLEYALNELKLAQWIHKWMWLISVFIDSVGNSWDICLAGGEIRWAESRCVELWGHPFCSTGGKSFTPVLQFLLTFPCQDYLITFVFSVFVLLPSIPLLSCRVPYRLTMTIYASSWRRWRAGCSTCPTSSLRTASPCSRAWLRSTLRRGSRYGTVLTLGSYTGGLNVA